MFLIRRLISTSVWITLMRPCASDCPGEFTCNEHQCISYSLVCNGNIDCDDQHSIAYEEYYVCLIEGCEKQFKCDDGKCIPFEKLCDSHSDCSGSEDETRCSISGFVCPSGSKCKNGMCIPTEWICDGTPHCHDESDESTATCNPEELTTQVIEESTKMSTEDLTTQVIEESTMLPNEDLTTQVIEESTKMSTEDLTTQEIEESTTYPTTSSMHHSIDNNGDESGIENSGVSVSGGGVLLGNIGDVQSSMNNGFTLRMNAMTIVVGLSLVRIIISSTVVIIS